MRVGSTVSIPIDVRLITATKIDLKDLVSKNLFRADLFYRINVVPIKIPPLRARRDDIPFLIEHFLQHYASNKKISLTNESLRAMVSYSWPGNVRELKNVVQRIALYIDNEIKLDDLPPEIRNENPIEFLLKACNKCYVDGSLDFGQIVKCLEHNLLSEALRQTNGNQTQAAKKLGLSLSTLRDKIKKHSIDCS